MSYEIHLNFAPVVSPISPFVIYRKLRSAAAEERPDPAVGAHKLPEKAGEEAGWKSYWVALKPFADFEPFTVTADTNHDVTRRAMFLALREAAASQVPPEDIWIPGKGFIEELGFVMERHPEGNELLIAQPYYLRATRQFGFLLDYHLRLGPDAQFTRRVQQLSLSLDKNFRRNLDYCIDRSAKIRSFVDARWSVFGAIQLNGTDTPLKLSAEFVALPASRLGSKAYLFRDGKESRGQFAGLREHGPLTPAAGPLRMLFVFRAEDRQAARRLAAGLKGSRDKFGFPGFEALFKVPIEIDNDPVILPDLSEASMKSAVDRAISDRATSTNLVPVLVLPAIEDNGYMAQKALFTHAEIPTQVCTLRILDDPDSLKWAIGNLALQIFCKAGGQPWKIRPTGAARSLIIGISQSHKIKRTAEKTEVEKYFAFSVLLDNSGLFQEIHVLGDSNTQSAYLAQLRATVRDVLVASAERFERVIVHTSFKLKRNEIAAIADTVRATARETAKGKCRFAVVKVNSRSRFFGANRSVNSQVPFEATKLKLGPREYLVWFEGIFPDKTTVNKPFCGPSHLQIMHVSDEEMPDQDLLQDLVNLSGANWRGFNAKSAPVSVFYCHLVADLVREFHERGLPLPAVKDIRPWFL